MFYSYVCERIRRCWDLHLTGVTTDDAAFWLREYNYYCDLLHF